MRYYITSPEDDMVGLRYTFPDAVLRVHDYLSRGCRHVYVTRMPEREVWQWVDGLVYTLGVQATVPVPDDCLIGDDREYQPEVDAARVDAEAREKALKPTLDWMGELDPALVGRKAPTGVRWTPSGRKISLVHSKKS